MAKTPRELSTFCGAVHYFANFKRDLLKQKDDLKRLFSEKTNDLEQKITEISKIFKNKCSKFYTTTDICNNSRGATNLQNELDGDLNPIAFATLTDGSQKQYAVGGIDHL